MKILCSDLSFYINFIAFPERMTNFSVTKDGNLYKGVVEWGNLRVRPEYFGKYVECDVKDFLPSNEAQMHLKKESIFYEEVLKAEQSSSVLFRFR